MACVGLISCVSRKQDKATEAKDLYVSALFNKSRKYVEQHCDRWYVLSAKYGLVDPNQVVEPYEETLNTKPQKERQRWAEMVWSDLREKLDARDKVLILAGARYREYLLPKIIEYGCSVDVPMEGKSIGKQLQWLSQQEQNHLEKKDLERLYGCWGGSKIGLAEYVYSRSAQARMVGLKSGIYFFFEPGEMRPNGANLRIVRVGTHGVSRGSKATLWNRLRTHKGTTAGSGNHRSSIFRLHVGAALSAREPSLAVPSWGVGQTADAEIRSHEQRLERAVSEYIGKMNVLWLAVEDMPSPASDRAYLERNLIGLLVGQAGAVDLPSRDWLGLHSPDKRIRSSGLWNLDYLCYQYSPDFLDVLDEYVSVTVNERQPPLIRLHQKIGILMSEME